LAGLEVEVYVFKKIETPRQSNADAEKWPQQLTPELENLQGQILNRVYSM